MPRPKRKSGFARPALSKSAGPPTARGPAFRFMLSGGTRMGDNPGTNVVDKWGFSHEAPESRHPERVGVGHARRAQSYRNHSGALLAHGGPPGEELEIDRRIKLYAVPTASSVIAFATVVRVRSGHRRAGQKETPGRPSLPVFAGGTFRGRGKLRRGIPPV